MGHYRIYRTRDGEADYAFSLEQLTDGTWRAYIRQQPGYRGRPSDAHSTHRFGLGVRPYVCWSEPLRTLDDALNVARAWSERTQDYIKYSRSF